MFRIVFIIIFCELFHTSYCQTADEYLDKANKAYDAQKKDEAWALYEKAAKLNSAEAHYQLAYRYVLTDDDRFYHLLEATKAGHEHATFDLFQEVFKHQLDFDSIARYALDAYEAGKKKNPALNFYFIDDEVATMKHCIEAGPLDMDAFMNKYESILDSLPLRPYDIWQIAEAVSRGRMGTPDSRLILQLACKDGSASMEKVGAVKAAYDSYKAGKVLEFNTCDYVTSSSGTGFCAQLRAEQAEILNRKRIKYLKSHLKNNAAGLLQNAYDKAVVFFDAKANREEGNGGSMYYTWIINSVITQKTEYLNMVERADSSKLPLTWSSDAEADKKLNDTYRQALKVLKVHPIVEMNSAVCDTDIIRVEQLWISYRDASAKLLGAIMPSIEEGKWKLWLTMVRTKQLKEVIEMSNTLNTPQH